MKNELLHLGPFTIYGYGLMIAIGILAAFWVVDYRCKKYKLNSDTMFWMAVVAVVGGMLGAKILFYITRLDEIIKDPSVLLSIRSGWVVYGGIIGGVFACWLFCKIKGIRFSEYLDMAVPSVALAQAFGRLGCLMSGCCYGNETTSRFFLMFTDSDYAPNHVHLIPTQPISAALNLAHFFILLFVARKAKKHGQVTGAYLTLYSVGRFIIEFYRGDLERGQVGSLSTSQFIAIFMFVFGAAILYFGCEWMDTKKLKPETVSEETEDTKE